MSPLTFAQIVQRQVHILQHISESLMMRAVGGKREHLDDLFAVQGHLEHWLQYLSPLAFEEDRTPLEAPPPLPPMRAAPPLAHETPAYQEAMAAWQQDEDGLRPHVTFPPEPPWVEALEQEQEGTA